MHIGQTDITEFIEKFKRCLGGTSGHIAQILDTDLAERELGLLDIADIDIANGELVVDALAYRGCDRSIAILADTETRWLPISNRSQINSLSPRHR